MNTKVILALAFLNSTYLYAAPPCDRLQCMPDRPELVGVEGKRIIPPGYMYVSEQSLEMKNVTGGGGGGGGGSASPEEVNNSGAKKAEKAKTEETQGDNFFKTAWKTAQSIAALIKSMGGMSGTATGQMTITKKANGDEVIKVEGCLSIAKGSHNKDTCTKADVKQRPDGKYFIEIKKLVAVQDIRKQWNLVYSTNDTMSFVVDDPEEVLNIFHAIDPTL